MIKINRSSNDDDVIPEVSMSLVRGEPTWDKLASLSDSLSTTATSDIGEFVCCSMPVFELK